MTDQNQDIGAAQRGQEFFRLKEVLQSPGQIFEINESARAIYIGPDSDIAEAQVTYFNPDEPLALETAVVSVNGPLVGRVDSLPVTRVPSTGQPAHLLVNAVDIVDNAYAPPASSAQRQFNIPTVLDLMFALKTLPDIPSVRADRTLRFPQVPYAHGVMAPPTDGSTDLIVPIYGRRMITVSIVAIATIDVSLSLISLLPGNPTVPRQIGAFTITGTAPATRQVRAAVIRASDAARNGVNFDLAGTPTTLYAESDQPPDPSAGLGGIPVCRGMADLLLINIADSTGAGGPEVTFFADVFVKLADRES